MKIISSNISGHHDMAEISATTNPEDASSSSQNISAVTAERVQGDIQLRARGSSHRDLAAPRQQHSNILREESLRRIQELFIVADDMSSIGKQQNQNLATEIQIASQIALPSSVKANDCVVLPPDVMAYWVRYGNEKKMLYACPEINGTGFGGIATMPPDQFGVVMSTYRASASEIKRDSEQQGQQPFVIVANSGREGAQRTDGGYPASSNSKMIWEKAHTADICAKEFGSNDNPCYPESFDMIAREYYREIDAAAQTHSKDSPAYQEAVAVAHANASRSMAQFDNKPLVLLGYSRDLAECAEIHDGRAYLFGREVNGIVNDRAIENLNMTQNKKLDYRKLALMNSTVDQGVNKFAAALARAEFAESEEAKQLPKIATDRGFKFDVRGMDKVFHYTSRENKGNIDGMNELQLIAHFSTFMRGVEKSEGIEGISRAYDDFMALGFDIRPIFKPNGTGQSKGIISPRTNESKEDFLVRFDENLKELEKNFGKGAGYPIHVEVLHELARTADDENYDLRFVIFQNRETPFFQGGSKGPVIKSAIQTIPLLMKKEPRSEGGHSGPLEFSPTNITAAVAKTGRPAIDFAIPLTSKAGMEQSGMDENLLKSMSLYFSAFQAFLLKKHYSRQEEKA